MADIQKPWQAQLVTLVEQVIRGGKAIAEISVREHEDRVFEFTRELALETPGYCITPIFDIRETVQHDVVRVIVVTDSRVLHLYDEVQALQGHDRIRHALLGYLFGYSTDAILEYLDHRTPSKMKGD
jgi:hypothetical protein